jgi:hypothetical protein
MAAGRFASRGDRSRSNESLGATVAPPGANGAATRSWSGMCAVATDRERPASKENSPYVGPFFLSSEKLRAADKPDF